MGKQQKKGRPSKQQIAAANEKGKRRVQAASAARSANSPTIVPTPEPVPSKVPAETAVSVGTCLGKLSKDEMTALGIMPPCRHRYGDFCSVWYLFDVCPRDCNGCKYREP